MSITWKKIYPDIYLFCCFSIIRAKVSRLWVYFQIKSLFLGSFKKTDGSSTSVGDGGDGSSGGCVCWGVERMKMRAEIHSLPL